MSLGIPYMGSKRKLAGEILHFITSRHPGVTDFYDLFGGGGSVSFTAVNDYRFNVHYNELNSHIYHLVDYLKNNKQLDKKFYKWVTREDFVKQLNRVDADWYSGFVMTCWSFGNNSQKGYLYGAEIQEYKRLAHEFIVNKCLLSMDELGLDMPLLTQIDGVQNRRIMFCDRIKKQNYFSENRLQNLEMLEHLTRLQNLQNLQITNLSYESVIINGNNPVIYCDIPYRGTAEYKAGDFNHDLFFEWCMDINYPVYVSEYNTPLNEVMAFRHRSVLSATNNKNKVVEKIFFNGKGDVFKNQLF